MEIYVYKAFLTNFRDSTWQPVFVRSKPIIYYVEPCSLPHQGNRDCYGIFGYKILGDLLGIHTIFFFFF